MVQCKSVHMMAMDLLQFKIEPMMSKDLLQCKNVHMMSTGSMAM